MAPELFLGLDLSTQSFTALVIDGATGAVVVRCSVNYDAELPEYATSSGMRRSQEVGGGERVTSPICMWLEAFDMLLQRVGSAVSLERVVAVSASAQQHGSVYWKTGDFTRHEYSARRQAQREKRKGKEHHTCL